MTETTDTAGGTTAAATPWHLWVVGIVGILWNAFGCYDYYMTETAGDAYLKGMGMTDAQLAYFHAMPMWMTAVWAIGVWGGLLGAILLLLKRKWAFPVFAASLAAYVLSLVYAYGLSDGGSVMGSKMYAMNAVILAGCVFFAWYSRLMAQRGVLR